MGCGSHSTNSLHHFSVSLLTLEKQEPDDSVKEENSEIKFRINSLAGENCKIVAKLTLVQYIYACTNKQIKSLFEDKKMIKSCLFFLFYEGDPNKTLVKYSEVYEVIPYDELKEEPSRILTRLCILDIRSIIKNKIKINDVISQMKGDYELSGRILVLTPNGEGNVESRLNTKEEKTDRDTKQDEDDEKPFEEGNKMDIFKDLTAETTKTFQDRIKNENITHFHIRKNHFADLNLFKNVIVALSKCENLRTFIFSDNYNTSGFENGWKILTQFLKDNKTIRNLNLSLSFLYDKYLFDLFNISLANKKITNLDLSCNFITLAGCKKIAEWLKTNTSLKTLNLQQNTMNEFKKEGSDIILSALEAHPKISTLDISNMILTGFGEKMRNFLMVNKTLKTLKLQNTRMNLDDFRHISAGVCLNNCLLELNISENDCKSSKAVEYVAEFVKANKTLTTLVLDNIGITEKNSESLFQAIKENEVIINYSFSENSKLLFKTLYEAFWNKSRIKTISFLFKDKKTLANEEDLIAKLKSERPDIVLNI